VNINLAPQHRKIPFGPRDPHEPHRVANTLELLYDLTFVVAFGVAGSNLAHQLAERHFQAGLIGFGIAMVGVIWAWINFSWFASAYDNDDWKFRTLTMIQMLGVVILALGIDPLFASLNAGGTVDNRAMVLGYVVMRVALLAQWHRVARHDPPRRRAARIYVITISVAQLVWIGIAVANTSLAVFLIAGLLAYAIEMTGPVLAERAAATPWHAHHIAERYGLLTIVALGEGIVGTVAALRALIMFEGWSIDVVVLGLAGVAVTWGLWWVYFTVPTGEALHRHRERSFGWGYSHILLFAAIAAVGAGLHVAALYLEHHSGLGPTATVATTAVPLAIALVAISASYSHLLQAVDPYHARLLALSLVVIGASLAMASAGVPIVWCLLVLSATPLISIVGYELHGHAHINAVFAADEPNHPLT